MPVIRNLLSLAMLITALPGLTPLQKLINKFGVLIGAWPY